MNTADNVCCHSKLRSISFEQLLRLSDREIINKSCRNSSAIGFSLAGTNICIAVTNRSLNFIRGGFPCFESWNKRIFHRLAVAPNFSQSLVKSPPNYILLAIASVEFPLWSLNSFSNVNDAKLSFNDRVFLSEQSVTCHSALRQCTAATATTITSRSAIRLIPLRSARKWNSPDRKNGEFWRTSASCRRLSWFNSQPFRCVGNFFLSRRLYWQSFFSKMFSKIYSKIHSKGNSKSAVFH